MTGYKLKVILIGANGDIGKAAYSALSPRHEIIKVGRNSGDIHADISNRESIRGYVQKNK